jgi:NAD-dependent dihydropyrimidine dehydrogenase PreA subunit
MFSPAIWLNASYLKGLAMAYVVAEPCVDVLDRACIAECPVDCIYEGARMMYIHPDECIDCGACESACPQNAISYDGELRAEWLWFGHSAMAFFAAVGRPGGAASVGPRGEDTPEVAALPRR